MHSQLTLRTVAALSLLLCVMVASAQPTTAASAPTTEIAVLRAQLQVTQSFHDSFVTMAVLALSTAIAITLALAAFSWFTSKANYERDRDLLREQTKLIRDETKVALREHLAELRSELEAALTAREVAIRSAVKKDLDAKVAAIARVAEEAKEIAIDLQAVAKLAEAQHSVERKMYGWAIYLYCQALELYAKIDADIDEAGEVFDKINAIVALPSVMIKSDNLSSSVAILQALPRRHSTIVEALIPRLKALLA